MEEEVVNKESRRGQEEKTHLSEEVFWVEHSGYRFFPPSNEVAGTYHECHLTFTIVMLDQQADRNRPAEKGIDRH